MMKLTKFYDLEEEGLSKSSEPPSHGSVQCLEISSGCPMSILPAILEAATLRPLEPRTLMAAWEAQVYNLKEKENLVLEHPRKT